VVYLISLVFAVSHPPRAADECDEDGHQEPQIEITSASWQGEFRCWTNRSPHRVGRTDDRAGRSVSRASLDHCGSHGQDSRLHRPVRSSDTMHRHGHVLSHAAFPTDGILHFVPQHGKPRTKSVRAEYELHPCATFSEPPRAAEQACYTCHTDYTMYGPLKDKLKGLRYLYMEYVSTPPKTIHLDGKYSNLQCLHCHAGMRDFEAKIQLTWRRWVRS
jgi:hypothetical protein